MIPASSAPTIAEMSVPPMTRALLEHWKRDRQDERDDRRHHDGVDDHADHEDRDHEVDLGDHPEPGRDRVR